MLTPQQKIEIEQAMIEPDDLKDKPTEPDQLEQAFVKCAGCGQRFNASPNEILCPDCEAESARAEIYERPD